MKVYYRDENVDELVCEVTANYSVSIEDVLNYCCVDMDKFASDRGWEDWDPNALFAVW